MIDEHLASYGRLAIDALDIALGERIIDIGCGPGATTRELACRVNPNGEVLGVDISPEMIRLARQHDAAPTVQSISPTRKRTIWGQGFDAAYARFAVMFFADHVAGLANIARALKPGGRLACVTWTRLRARPWMYVRLAAAPLLGRETRTSRPPGP